MCGGRFLISYTYVQPLTARSHFHSFRSLTRFGELCSHAHSIHLRGLILLIFAIGIETFNIKVSFRLEFSYIGLCGGGGFTALIRCAAASYQLKMVILVVRGTKDNIIDIKQ